LKSKREKTFTTKGRTSGGGSSVCLVWGDHSRGEKGGEGGGEENSGCFTKYQKKFKTETAEVLGRWNVQKQKEGGKPRPLRLKTQPEGKNNEGPLAQGV